MLTAGTGADVVTIERERPVSAKRRRVAPSPRKKASNRMPHIGAKEQERAKRLFMVSTFGGPSNPFNESPRCAPTLCQMSKRQFASYSREA
nr:hypothetical protein [Paraburkholderia sp. BL8N3]